MVEVQGLLRRTRLLTLTGAGGCGKTRLAVEVSRSVEEEFERGAWIAGLASIGDPGLVPAAVASALSVREEHGHPLSATIAEAIGEGSTLLVLDNCEHVLPGCVQLGAELLEACQGLRIMATSQQALSMDGETVWRVPSLAVPDETAGPQEVLASHAGLLFVDRARAVEKTFTLTSSNAPAVGRICRRLDGMPLAIELAAARVRMLTPQQIDTRLGDRFGLLTGGNARALPRHRTLRALLDWSYELLTEEERLLFRRLSVFTGGSMIDGAESVCSGEGLEESEVLDLLDGLVTKSLLVLDEQGEQARYRMLETVRQYAGDRLRESGEEQWIRPRHLRWLVSLFEKTERAGSDRDNLMDLLAREVDNIRAALDWSIHGGDVESGLRLLGVRRFYQLEGWLRLEEARAWLETLLARTGDVDQAVRARALYMAGGVMWLQGAGDAATRYLEEGLRIRRSLQDRTGTAECLWALGLVASMTGDYERARALTEESLTVARGKGDRYRMAEALTQLGQIDSDLGAPATARSLAEEGLALARAVGERHVMADALSILGAIARDEGEHGRARTLQTQALALQGEIGDRPCSALSLRGLGQIAAANGEHVRALGLLAQALEIQTELRQKSRIAETLWEVASVESARGEPVRAAWLLGAAESLWGELGVALRPSSLPRYQRTLHALRARLGGDAFDTARAEGQSAQWDGAVAYAMASLEPEELERLRPSPWGEAGQATGIFRLEGDYWTVAFAEGSTFRVKDAKGLRYIHHLLAHPGQEFHVAELVGLTGGMKAPGEAPRPVTEAALEGGFGRPGHAGEVLDARAKAEYVRRIRELEEEIEEAGRWQDLERRARAQEELDFISHELAAAFGLGGRARKATDVAERVRKAVSNRIRDSMARIRREHPALGQHLANALHTGTFCSYTPDRPIEWRL